MLYGMYLDIFIVASSFTLFAFLIMTFVYVPRMQRFLKYNSIAHAIGGIYNNDIIRIIIGLTGFITCAGFIAVQFKIFGIVMGYFTNISPAVLIIICGTIVTLYSTMGGIKAVTFTDIVQFGIFAAAVPIIGIMIWNHLYSIPAINSENMKKKFSKKLKK